MTYRLVPGIDYGPRKGTLGLGFHMAEGGDGTLGYLARRSGETDAAWRTRIRGVSCHVVILSTGEVVQMVDFDNAAGSLNPLDRNPDTTGYYNGTILRDVLGDKLGDPNAYSITTEITGFRAAGPNVLQVAAATAWAKAMRARYPTIRGAFGHADQTDTKGCPGTTTNMKAIFAGIGGHGLWTQETDMGEHVTPFAAPLPFTVPNGTRSFGATPPYDELSTVSGPVSVDGTVVIVQTAVPHGSFLRIVTGATGRRLVAAAGATPTGTAPTDCTGVVAAEHERTRKAAIAAVEAIK